MKKTIEKIIYRNQLKFTLLFVFGILFTVGFACESGGDKVPPDAELNALLKETTTDFAEFIESGDFSKIYNKASADFRSTYTLDQATKAFSVFLDKKELVLPNVKSASGMNPTFSKPPAIRQEKGNNILVTAGQFDSKPFAVKFEYEYVWRDGGWKLLKLVVNVG